MPDFGMPEVIMPQGSITVTISDDPDPESIPDVYEPTLF